RKARGRAVACRRRVRRRLVPLDRAARGPALRALARRDRVRRDRVRRDRARRDRARRMRRCNRPPWAGWPRRRRAVPLPRERGRRRAVLVGAVLVLVLVRLRQAGHSLAGAGRVNRPVIPGSTRRNPPNLRSTGRNPPNLRNLTNPLSTLR